MLKELYGEEVNISELAKMGANAASKVSFKANKVSPEVLVIGGVVGLVAAGVLAARATLKLEPIVSRVDQGLTFTQEWVDDETQPEYTESSRKKDVVKIYRWEGMQLVKLYVPSVSLGLLSVGCILGGHHILRQRNIALVAAYKLIETSYSKYRKRVASEIGDEKEAKIYSGQKKEMVLNEETGKKKGVMVQDNNGYSPYSRFFDVVNSKEYKKNRPDLNQFFILSVQRYSNQRLETRGYVFLNEVYIALGMSPTPAGQIVGWLSTKNGGTDGFIDFGIDNPDNEMARMFLSGDEAAVLLDFNVDGPMYTHL